MNWGTGGINTELRSRPGGDKPRPYGIVAGFFVGEGERNAVCPPDRQLAKSCNLFGGARLIFSTRFERNYILSAKAHIVIAASPSQMHDRGTRIQTSASPAGLHPLLARI